MRALVLGALSTVAAFNGEVVAGQQVPPAGALGDLRNLSRSEIARRIQQSGLSEAQIRDRLRQAGYDPALADRYFDREGAEGLQETSPEDGEFLSVLQAIGISLAPQSDSLFTGRDTVETPRESLSIEADSAELRVFGIDVFRQRTTQFNSSFSGPVGPSYPLGPGDEIFLVLTGDVEQAYRLSVSREGTLVIPSVGQLSVNGLTLGDLEDVLYNRLGRVYSGVTRGPDASTRFDVSLGRLRSNQVYVVGEVSRPGAYQISSVGTMLEALYAAGGPSATGSFRLVSVRRRGSAVGAFDLYDYLTAGETAGIPRLEEGDVVFVPPVGAQVSVDGEVLRPAIYEIRPGEGVEDVIWFAGGLMPSARTDAVRVERIVPRFDRVDGRDRIVVDVDYDLVVAGRDSLALRAGDHVEVLPLREDQRGWVEITGAVYRPGRYELSAGATVSTLIERAGGAFPDALESVLHIRSLNREDGSTRLVRVPIDVAASVPLREFDEVTLFGRDSLLVGDSVGVFGLVARPGRYALSVGVTAEDLILMAGGLSFGADPRRAEITRMTSSADDGVTVSRALPVALTPALPYPGPATRDSLPPVAVSLPPAQDVPLMPGDEVYVRQVPQYRAPRRVEVTGEVVTPGTYVLSRMDERVSSLVERAGGLTGRAFRPGFRLIRDGITVGVDLDEALAAPGSAADPVLRDDDRLVVPVFDATVLVSGEVAFETRVVYQEGMDLDDVLSEAGGVTPSGDRSRISVEYANGSRRTVKRVLGINVAQPEIRPGSTVFVPLAPEGTGFDWDSALSRVLAVGTTLATLVIALK